MKRKTNGKTVIPAAIIFDKQQVLCFAQARIIGDTGQAYYVVSDAQHRPIA